jgi:tetratricopeptide (TPR) repeat protein
MTAGGDWGEIIDKEEAERFVGREWELETFRQQISRIPPRYLIFYITGQGGVGKTTLLNRYREIAKDFSFLLTDCDELQRDIPAVLGRFAHQLAEQGYSLRRFNERYKTYRQKMDEIENDPEAPQGLAALVGRTVVRATFIAGDMVPGLRKGLDYLPRETVETQASEWAMYLAKKLTNKDEVALVREPTPILTSLFFEDLNEIAKKQRVLLCFENFEATRQELQNWFLRLREYRPSQGIRIVIAGRDQPGAKWDPLRSVTMIVRLDVFTEQEAEAFLDTYKITDSGRRTEILEFSDRLPVMMNWLAAPEGQEPDPSVPTHDIVGRFLRWVTEPAWQQVALVAALPRSFNVDTLKLLLEYREQTVDEQSSFAWLLTMPFVKQHADGWRYHDVVRRMMLHYQRQESPQTYRKTHMALAGFYNTRRDELGLPDEEQWTNEQWRADTLAYAYHFLVADPIKHWGEVVSLFVVAVRKRRAFAIEMMELLSLGDVRDELAHEHNEMVQLFRQQLQAVEDGELKDGFAMFDRLCNMIDLIPQAKGYVLAYRGERYSQDEKWEKALHDFEEALHHISEDARTVGSRGETYLLMGRYPEALADFERAIALDEKAGWYRYRRAQVYMLIGQIKAFESDIQAAIELGQATLHSKPDDCQSGFNLALYYLAAGNVTETESQYTHFASACSSLAQLQDAVDDLTDFLAIQPFNEQAQRTRTQPQTRIAEFQQTPTE